MGQVLQGAEEEVADLEEVQDTPGAKLLCSRQDMWSSLLLSHAVDAARQATAVQLRLDQLERRRKEQRGQLRPEERIQVEMYLCNEARLLLEQERRRTAGHVSGESEQEDRKAHV